MKTIVTSIPKSGTYLAREVLVNAGLRCDPRHITQGERGPYTIDGDFRVGHAGYAKTDHKVVFLYRNLRDVIVSSIKFMMLRGDRPLEEITPEYLIEALDAVKHPPKIDALMGWLDKADLCLSFERLQTVGGVKDLYDAVLGYCTDAQAEILLQRSVNKPTTTWSGTYNRSDHTYHWSPDVERAWKLCPLYPYNILLGYEEI